MVSEVSWPCLVREMRIRGYAVDFDAQFLEFGVVVRQITELGRATKVKSAGLKHDYGPLALEVSFVTGTNLPL